MRQDFGNFNTMLAFCRENALHLDIFYGEASDTMMVMVFSDSPADKYSEKRIISFEHFIKNWKEGRRDEP